MIGHKLNSSTTDTERNPYSVFKASKLKAEIFCLVKPKVEQTSFIEHNCAETDISSSKKIKETVPVLHLYVCWTPGASSHSFGFKLASSSEAQGQHFPQFDKSTVLINTIKGRLLGY